MKKGRLIGKILGIALTFVLVGTMFGGSIHIAADEVAKLSEFSNVLTASNDTLVYDGSVLPEDADPPWVTFGGGSRSTDGNILTVNTVGMGCEEKQYSMNDIVDSAKGIIVEARVKIGAIGDEGTIPDTAIVISDSEQAFKLVFLEDRIAEGRDSISWDNLDNYCLVDTVSDFHVYKITVKNSTAKVYVDGIARLTLAGFPYLSNCITFGEVRVSCGGMNGLSYWDYVKISTGLSSLADSPWPKFRHDAQNTGRSPYTGPEVPELKWTSSGGSSSPAIGTDGTVYTGSGANLYALNPDGTVKWAFSTGAEVYSSPAIGVDGTVYVGSHDYNLYAIDPTGTEKWRFATGSCVDSSPSVGADGTIYVGSRDGNLYAIDSEGSMKWNIHLGQYIMRSSPAIGTDNTIYVGTVSDWADDWKLHAINPDGTIKWSLYVDGRAHSSPAIAADGTIYIGTGAVYSLGGSNGLWAIDPAGTPKWFFATENAVESSAAIGADGTIYVGSVDTNVYALNPNGTKKWNFGTGGLVQSSPAVGADGIVYVGSLDGKLYAINPQGTEKWSFDTGYWIFSSPAIAADGTIYVGAFDGRLYAIGEGAPPPDGIPIAGASDISGQPQVMYPGTNYTISARYFDPDGRDDLKYCYLRLKHPSKNLTMMWNEATDDFWVYAGEEGENYLTVTGNSTPITDGSLEGYELTWNFTINDQWPEVENAIDFGVSAWDDSDLKSGWDYDSTKASFSLSGSQAKWTVLVYMDGDSDFEKAAVDSFLQMASIGSSSDVSLLVQMDRIDPDHLPPNTYDDTRYGDWSVCHRFYVGKDMEPTETNAIDDWGDGTGGREVNMGDPNTLASFVSWAVENYPAESYSLILPTHGTGFRGFGYDMTPQLDNVSLLELKEALESAGTRFGVIGFDACYMGLIEVAYQIKDYTDYVVASQEATPYGGWPYHTISGDLVNVPAMSGEALAGTIVTRYAEYYGADAPEAQRDAITTVAAVCTVGLDVLAAKLDEFAQKLESGLATYRAQIRQSRDSVEWYSLATSIQYYENIYVDICHFAELIKQNLPDQGVRDSADSVINALNNAVISEWHYHPDGKHPNSHGLSIYFTKEDHPERQYDSKYDDLDFAKQTHWDEFVRRYLGDYGYAIIVAGQGGWREKRSFDHSANNAYRVLRNLGFDDRHIYYLNSNRPQDIDNDDNHDDEVDAQATLSAFVSAMNDVRNKIGGSSTPLILYLTGHGVRDPDCFVFDESVGAEGYLWVPALQEMLNGFTSRVPMLAVIGSCYSGCFITSCEGISAANRIILTAAHDDQARWSLLGLGGWSHSSDRFWGNLNMGSNVKDAFVSGAWPGEISHLWLDDNGDGIGSPPDNLGNDGKLASATKIGLPGSEDLKVTPWQAVWMHSPGELRVYDSQNRVTGLISGEVREEIPDSVYDQENQIVAIFAPPDSYSYQVAGIDEGTYGLGIACIEGSETITFSATDIPTAVGAVHQYAIDWDALSEGEEGVTVQIDSDGDGIFEDTFTSDRELTQDEFLEEVGPPPSALEIFAFGDANVNGQPDPGEEGLGGWHFEITGPNGYRWKGSTSPTGLISFEDLAEGVYTVRETLKEGWYNTTPLVLKATVRPDTSVRLSFGNREELRDIPPMVPSMNRWGVIIMIALFAGSLVWTTRRRRLA
jgi:outer membrane protein assembly factor BamB